MAKAEYRSAKRSRKLITEALADLILEKPIDKITVTDVVKRADINRGTFYAHFTDISDVLNQQIHGVCNVIRETLEDEIASGIKEPNPHLVLEKIQELIEGEYDFYSKLTNSDLSDSVMSQIRDIFVEFALEHEKEFSTLPHERYVSVIRFTSGGILQLYKDFFLGKLDITLDELTERITIMCLKCLAD